MLHYQAPDQELVILTVLIDQKTDALTQYAETMLVRTIPATGTLPAAGDVLQPMPYVRLLVRYREFELREGKVYLWIHTEKMK